jgi:hypothetical protein
VKGSEGMAIKEVSLNRIPAKDSVLYINKSGLTFSALFIRKHDLSHHKGIKFFSDDEDPYYLGFQFTMDNSGPNTLSLMASGRSKGGTAAVTIKAAELINRSTVLKSLQKLTDRADKRFEIICDSKLDLYYVMLRPNFEITISWSDRNKIPDHLIGIYRYRSRDGQVLYIGKGQIKSRANSPERKEWGIEKIEYSVLRNDEKCSSWENYHLERFVSATGAKPPFNVIMGKSDQYISNSQN